MVTTKHKLHYSSKYLILYKLHAYHCIEMGFIYCSIHIAARCNSIFAMHQCSPFPIAFINRTTGQDFIVSGKKTWSQKCSKLWFLFSLRYKNYLFCNAQNGFLHLLGNEAKGSVASVITFLKWIYFGNNPFPVTMQRHLFKQNHL